LLREVASEWVAFVIGEPFHVDGGGQQNLRISFAFPGEHEIEEGIKRIGGAIKRLQSRRNAREEQGKRHMETIPMV
jgi:DNA-binding transcriptional MocR family regulator